MRYFFTILLFVSYQETFPNIPEWFEGVVVLRDQRVLTGEIFVNQQYDLVIFRNADSLCVFPAVKIQSFSFYNPQDNINHRFTSVQQNVNSFTAYHLYEIVLNGEIAVYRRLAGPFSDSEEHKTGYRYFIFLNDEYIALSKFRSKIFPHMLKVQDNLKEYVRTSHLDPNNKGHAILIIDHFNKSAKADDVIAKH
jgi:hypothetical protein